MTTGSDEESGLGLAYDALHGLSVGDALGAQFFVPGRSVAELTRGQVPAPPWEWTDDTEMACAVVSELRDHGDIDQDRLAHLFAVRCEPYRGYGPGSVMVLHAIRDGTPWQVAAAASFNGDGSCGNGAAMRVAPLGAYFTGSLERAADAAARSARVTHAHAEGIAGAVAVAVAAAVAGVSRRCGASPDPAGMLDEVAAAVSGGPTADGIRRAAGLLGCTVAEAAYELGNGSQSTSQDSVPFALWAVATHITDYPAAIKACIQAGGDVDTTAAMAGGIVATYTGVDDRPGAAGVPRDWLAARELLPTWAMQR
ncbi:MAG TPA: ADP-ribosylglycohydrolase family protein [Streptosporangiaceae bacterium]|nr:ADP-ribosylglycohydrolase family protein [Streptosporangiaceae bacterium]